MPVVCMAHEVGGMLNQKLFHLLISMVYKSVLMVRFVVSLHLPLGEFFGCMVMVEMPGL